MMAAADMAMKLPMPNTRIQRWVDRAGVRHVAATYGKASSQPGENGST